MPCERSPPEPNLLGWRGIRVSSAAELFKQQLGPSTCLRGHARLRHHVPLVSGYRVVTAKHILQECREELKGRTSLSRDLKVGIALKCPAPLS
ncbi:MAG: putative PEP-binding protein [Akkermansia sp.]